MVQKRPPRKESQQERTEDNDDSLILKENNADICQQLMDRYAKSSAEQHRHLLATAAAMRSILAAESLPPTPPAYFAAAISAADSAVNSPGMDCTAMSSLLTFLSIVIPMVPQRGIAADKACEALAVTVGLVEREVEQLGVAGMRCGVKCLGSILVRFCDLDDWKSVRWGFEGILKFSIDKRPKVRRCAQECLEELFRSFRSSAVIKEASKSVYSLLEKYMPVAINLTATKIDEGSKGNLMSKPESMEAMHLLNLLSVTIPFLSDKVSSKVLLLLRKIMIPEYSALTRQIFRAIEVFFATSRDEIVIPKMEGIIASLTEYVSLRDKNPVDTVMDAATLLKSGLEKLYSVEPRLCLGKLPIVCGSLAGLLTSADDNASQASVLLKDLINNHLDKKFLLICESQWLEENEEMDAVRSVCGIVESSLDLCDAIPSEYILAVISLLFRRLGELSGVFMRSIVLKLANLITKGDASNTELLQKCIGSAIVAMGPERMLKLIPISFNVDDLTYSNTWLVPVLKKYVVGASLGYYMEHIVPLAKSFQLASTKVKKPQLSKELQAHAHGLLGLLSAFSRFPSDTEQKFGPLAEFLVTLLNKYPLLHETVALSIQVLVNQNKSMLRSKDAGDAKTSTGEDSILEPEIATCYSKKMANKNIRALASGSTELLQALVDIFVGSHPGTCLYLKDAIGCLASITDSSFTKKIFMQLLENLEILNGVGETEGKEVQTSESIEEEKVNPSRSAREFLRRVVLDLASALVEGAKEDLIELIYNFICQTFQVTEETGYQQAYHTLSRVLEEHDQFCSSRFVELIDMLLQLKSPDDVGSLRSRFACFHILMVHTFKMNSEEENEKSFLMLNEIILKLKDGNEESRKAAYDVLTMIHTSLKGSSVDNSDATSHKLISMIMGYLSSSSPHVKSGAVSALSVLVYKDPDICLTTPDLVSSLLSLLQTKAIEVIKAVLGFVKVLVSSLESKDLQNLLSDLVTGILPWSSVSRHHFRSKVVIILEIMIRKCGSWAVQSLAQEKYRGFVKTVVENRSVKTSSKRETTDQEMPRRDSAKEPQKRKRKSSDGFHGEKISEDQKTRKRPKKSFSNLQGSKKPFAFINGHRGSKDMESLSKRPGHSGHENSRNGDSGGNRRNGKPGFSKGLEHDQKRKTGRFRRTNNGESASSGSKMRKPKKFGKK